MTYTRKEVGDAVGYLFGVAVDACKSHHASHLPPESGHTEKPGSEKPRDESEIGRTTATSSLRCDPSWTGVAGQTTITVEAASAMTLASATMTMLEAGKPISTQPNAGAPSPNQIPAGVTPVTISIYSGLARGLYFGRLRSAAGAALDEPVLIYIDGIS